MVKINGNVGLPEGMCGHIHLSQEAQAGEGSGPGTRNEAHRATPGALGALGALEIHLDIHQSLGGLQWGFII